MTPEEAATVESIVLTADGGCGTCVDALTRQLMQAFPEHDWFTLRHTVTAWVDRWEEDE